ncbi:MAG TPA: methyltransferase domain-containing protein [Thermoanaerobaculia bacterium]|nr:methyltransferase domain-containing protein [Thermoanaerobaculia bacterium]
MWSPEQYARFAAERKQPFTDLLSLIERHPRMRVVDLGCGTGELTRELHESLGAEETVGIDESETMLLKAGHFGGEMLRFEQGNIEAFVTDRPYDLIFSNAALHWIADHEALLARLTSFLSVRGQLAVQMPLNDDHPSHRVAAEVAGDFGLAPRPDPILPVERYAELLYRLGYQRQHVRLQVYGHVLPSADDVVEWVRGALLTHYQSQLPGGRFEEFLDAYRARLRGVLGEERPFFYTYKRILLWGAR